MSSVVYSTEYMKKRIYEIISVGKIGDRASRIFDLIIVVLIVVNAIGLFLNTFSLEYKYVEILAIIEIVCLLIFTIEYILRVYVADLKYPELTPFKARLKHMREPMSIIDFLAIFPVYLAIFNIANTSMFMVLRLFRLLRLFKLNRYSNSLGFIGNVLKEKADQLISSFFVIFLIMIFGSVLMYYFENPVQPDVFENGFSGLWWAVATFTTVGYGDIYPITAAGKIVSSIIAFLGIGLVAVPTGIITSGFNDQLNKKKNNAFFDEADEFCPHCGKKIK